MLIVLGEPSKGKYYGGEIAAPVFKAILEDMSQLSLFATEVAHPEGGRMTRSQ